MAKHPCGGLPYDQVQAFEQIATGTPLPVCKQGTLAALERAGLIERAGEKKLRDEMGFYTLPQYQVPVGVHIEWCRWCSEQSSEEL